MRTLNGNNNRIIVDERATPHSNEPANEAKETNAPTKKDLGEAVSESFLVIAYAFLIPAVIAGVSWTLLHLGAHAFCNRFGIDLVNTTVRIVETLINTGLSVFVTYRLTKALLNRTLRVD